MCSKGTVQRRSRHAKKAELVTKETRLHALQTCEVPERRLYGSNA